MLDFFDRYDILDSDFVERQKKGHTTAGMILFLSFFYQNTRSAVLYCRIRKETYYEYYRTGKRNL